MSLLVLDCEKTKVELGDPKRKKMGLQDQLFGRIGVGRRRNRMLMLDLQIISFLEYGGYLHPIPPPRHVYSPILLWTQAGVGMIVREFRRWR